MTSAFSSNDVDVLHRISEINDDELIVTSHDQLPEVYEIERCVQYIDEHQFEKVALQFPDELLADAANVTRILQEKTQAKVFLLADTSYGSHDIDEVAAQHIQADLIIHYGNSALMKSTNTQTMFVFGQQPLNYNDFYNCFNETYCDRNAKIILFVQPQWYHTADVLEAHLKASYTNVLVGRIVEPDQPTNNSDDDGCINACPDCTCRRDQKGELINGNSAGKRCQRIGIYEVELTDDGAIDDYSIFYVGTENSETLRNITLHLSTCSGFVFEPRTSRCLQISSHTNRVLMKRLYVVEQIKDAKTVGILVGTMGMAGFREIIAHLKKIFAACGKKTYTFVVGKLNPNKLANFPEIDIFVLVACPEESMIDSKEYFKPISTPYEAELACNVNREWSNIYPLDFRQLLPGGKFFVDFRPRSEDSDVSLITGNLRHHADDALNDELTDIAVRNTDSSLSVFHPNSAARHFASRSWSGLEQKLGETPVESAQEGRSGLPISYTYQS